MIEPTHDHIALDSGVELHVLHWEPEVSSTAESSAWILTHGLASNARLWDGVARRLAERGHRVATVDQRGHGRSSKPDGPYDVPTCADDLALLVDALGFDRAPSVGGQSWGGNVVLELGHRHPGVVEQVVCVDGGFIDLQSQFPSWDDCAEALAPPRLAGTPAAQMQEWIDRSAADWPPEGRAGTMANFEVRDDGTIAPWLTFERHLTVLRGLWEHRPASRFADLRVPALLIAADNSHAGGGAGWSSTKQTAVDAAVEALPRGRAEWFRPAHHDVHAQHPDPVADLLEQTVTDPSFYDR